MATRYATLDTRSKLKHRVDAAKECKSNPVAWDKIQNKLAFDNELKKQETSLNDITPPTVDGEKRGQLRNRMNQLQEAMVQGSAEVPPMPSRRDMWEHISDGVDRHMKWEKYWKRHTLDLSGNPIEAKNKRGGVWEWKDLARTVGYNEGSEEDSPNLANVENFRPSDSRPSLAEQRTPRSYGLTTKAKAKYDEVFPDHKPTPVEAKIEEASVAKDKVVADLIENVDSATTTSLRCKIIKKNGKRCGLPCIKGKDACFIRSHQLQGSMILPSEV